MEKRFRMVQRLLFVNLFMCLLWQAGAQNPKISPGFDGRLGYKVEFVKVPERLPAKVYTTERVGMSRKTHEAHLKLWQGYAKKTNEIRKKLAEMKVNPEEANSTYSDMRELKVEYSFAYDGYMHHHLFFNNIGGSGGVAIGRVADLIRKSYGSFENWAKDWKATGMAARGWVFMGYDPIKKQVFNYIGDSQNTYPVWNHVCLLAMDMYEHAYYLDFLTERMKYIDGFMQVIDWDEVNNRLERVLEK